MDKFIRACETGDVKTVKHYLSWKEEPKERYNKAMYTACSCNQVEVVRLLLDDNRVDAASSGNLPIRWACQNGNVEVVRLLLAADPRVNPALWDNYPIRSTSKNGFVEVVCLLLADSRVDPTARDNEAIRDACKNECIEVIKLLLQDLRVDASEAKSDNPEIRELLAQWKYHPR